MNIIAKKIKALQAIQDNRDKWVLEFIDENKDLVLSLNRAQLYEGQKGDNTPTAPPYAPSTIQRKQRKGQPTSRVTLKDDADFYDSLGIEFGEKEFTIIADDFKTKYLKGKYGKDILGLNDESIEVLLPKLKEHLSERVKQTLSQ